MADVQAVRIRLQRRANDMDLEKALRLLFSGLKTQSGMDLAGSVAAYAIALEGVSAHALDVAVHKLLRGKTPPEFAFSRTFAPATPELLTYVEWLERDMQARATTVERMFSLREEGAPSALSPDEVRQRLSVISEKTNAAAKPIPSDPVGFRMPAPGYGSRVQAETAAKRADRAEKERGA